MIDAGGVGFMAGGGDAHGNGARRATDAPLANQLERAGERTPRPTTWFSLCRAHRLCGEGGGNRTFSPLFSVLGSASRPSAAHHGRKTTMHDTNDTTTRRDSI
jgi:hypothetical protein